MKQMTLWESGQSVDLAANLIWEQLDTVVKRDVVKRLSLLMVKAVHPTQIHVSSEKENSHESS